MTEKTKGSKTMYVGVHFAGAVFTDMLGNSEEAVLIDEKGFGTFFVDDGSVSVYCAKDGFITGEMDDEFIDPHEVGALDEVTDKPSEITFIPGEEKEDEESSDKTENEEIKTEEQNL